MVRRPRPHPGHVGRRAGQSFIPSSIAKVRQIKTLLGTRAVEISVDGGVTRDKAGALAQAGADILVAGSAIFGAQDPAQAVRDLRSASEGSQ
jgi:ribulose-phosphate 3-epimerase